MTIKMDMDKSKIPLKNRNGNIVDYAIIDPELFELLSRFKWYISKGYATSYIDKDITMHRFLMGPLPSKKYIIDHINTNKLDNREENLRFATHAQNIQNKIIEKDTTSKYIGVFYNKDTQKFHVQCKHIYFKMFNDEIEAAKTYDKAAYILFGKNARTNGLINYEEVENLTIEDLKAKKVERDLPNHITYEQNKYRVSIYYNKKKYSKFGFETIEDALIKRDEFYREIEKIKEQEKQDFLNKEITRNNDGVAIIKIKDVEILVDDDKWHELKRYKWSLLNKKYVNTQINGKFVLMHKYLLNLNDDTYYDVIDHINRNPLDNRLINLRVATYAQNSQNRDPSMNKLSKFMGVTPDRRNEEREIKWIAKISIEKTTTHIGSYKTEIEAAVAYNIKAREIYGPNAYTNNIENEEEIIKTLMTEVDFAKKDERLYTSKYVGVGFIAKTNKYRVRLKLKINNKNKEHSFGNYDNEIDAAIVYNIIAKHYYKDAKKLNKINISQNEYSKKEEEFKFLLENQGKLSIKTD